MSTASSRRLRIGKRVYDTQLDYELCSLPHNFVLVNSPIAEWNFVLRSLPANVKFANCLVEADLDLLILDTDQNAEHQVDIRWRFDTDRAEFSGPIMVINHGCNLLGGCSSAWMRAYLGDLPTVCLSKTARRLWNIKNSRVIRHGLNPDEWRQTDYGRQCNIVVNQPIETRCGDFFNNRAVTQFEKRYKLKVDWIQRDYRFTTVEKYKTFLLRSGIYFNPSYAAPDPISRTEAMMCGLAVVTTCSHGESEYIVNGMNGFASNSMEQLFEYLVFLFHNPGEVRRIGMAGRATATSIFSSSRFLNEFNELVNETYGGIGGQTRRPPVALDTPSSNGVIQEI